MFRYLKEAFFLRVPVPGLGAVPLNILGLICFGILGFGELLRTGAPPSLWFLGAALELSYLTILSTNKRFQRLIKGMDAAIAGKSVEEKRSALVSRLTPDAQSRLHNLESRCTHVLDLYQQFQIGQGIVGNNQDAFKMLQWLYLKLLVARHYLTSSESKSTQTQIKRQFEVLEAEIASGQLTDTARESKTATLEILRRRLENLQRREQLLQEIDSDLARIDAQVDLAMETATVSGQPQAVSTNINFVSQLLDDGMYGQAQSAVADLESALSHPAPQAEHQ